MYWLKKTDEQAGVVRFKVLGGYECGVAMCERDSSVSADEHQRWVRGLPALSTGGTS